MLVLPGERTSRRGLLAAAGGLTTAALAGLAGCGSSTPRTPTNPEFRTADAEVLDGLLVIENRGVAVYAHAASLLRGPEADLARRIGAQEASHVYALTGAIYRLGGTPTPKPATYAFSAADGRAALALAGAIEDTAIAACIDAVANLTDLQARGTVVGVANSDAQHAVLIAQARGLPPLSAAIVRGRA
ncbi:MAG: ferritin-like domain-containing protein [Solirubrobacteraceae bacterium]